MTEQECEEFTRTLGCRVRVRTKRCEQRLDIQIQENGRDARRTLTSSVIPYVPQDRVLLEDRIVPHNGQPPDRPHEDLTTTLIVRLRGGDAGAGELLELLYRDAMHRFCLSYLYAVEDAEDGPPCANGSKREPTP